MNIINLTPHPLNIKCLAVQSVYHPDGENWGDTQMSISPSGTVARIENNSIVEDPIILPDGEYCSIRIPVTHTSTGEIIDLPDPKDNTIYVTSTMVAQAAVNANRTDVYAPGELIRNDKGQVVGCNGLNMPQKSPLAKLAGNLSLDIARLQGCHVEDSEYEGSSEIFK